MSWIEKQKNVLDFTLSSLLRRRGKNIALTIVYALVVFFLTSVMFFTYSLKREAALVLRGAPEIVVQRLVAGRSDLMPLSHIDVIKKIRGVQSVEKRLWGYYYDPRTGANYTFLVSGDFPCAPGEMIAGNGVARSLHVRKNDSIPFRTYDGSSLFLRIKGIYSAESELVSSDLILVSDADFRKLFCIPEDLATDLVLKVRNKKELTTVAAKITQLLPDCRPILINEILSTYEAVFNWRGGLLLVIMSGAVLAFVIFAWDKATGLSAEERKEIGILKAVGWETSDILLMKFWEGVVVSLSSFLVGVLLAYIHIFFTSSVLLEPVLKGWSALYPRFRLTPFISAYHVAILFFFTVVPYTVATIVPSWKAATVDPDSIMKT